MTWRRTYAPDPGISTLRLTFGTGATIPAENHPLHRDLVQGPKKGEIGEINELGGTIDPGLEVGLLPEGESTTKPHLLRPRRFATIPLRIASLTSHP